MTLGPDLRLRQSRPAPRDWVQSRERARRRSFWPIRCRHVAPFLTLTTLHSPPLTHFSTPRPSVPATIFHAGISFRFNFSDEICEIFQAKRGKRLLINNKPDPLLTGERKKTETPLFSAT